MFSKIPNYKKNQVLFDGSTDYEHYEVVDTKYNNRQSRMLYTDHRTAAQSGIAFDDQEEMLFDYNERFIELIKGLEPKRVLVIGGGAFTLPMGINNLFPKIYVDVFELDGGLPEIANKYFGFKENTHLKVHIGDGRELLKRTRKKYDLIILDVYNSVDIPDAFQSPMLAYEVKDKLTPEGVAAMNVIGAYHGQRAEILNGLTRSFEEALLSVEVFPAGDVLSIWISQNFVLVAGNKAKDVSKYMRYGPVYLSNNLD